MQLERRHLLFGAAAAAASASPLLAWAATQKLDLRIWPDDDSTRISIESDRKLKFRHMILRGTRPYRLVLDIEGMQLTNTLAQGLKNLKTKDRFISAVRPGQFKPDVLRLVFDLKTDINAAVNYSKPVANFKHRIIVDITPTNADLMKQVIDSTGGNVRTETADAKPPAKPNTVKETERRIKRQTTPKKGKTETLVVVIDPGHGGEDPGAVGRRKTKEKDVVLAISQKLAASINRTKGMRAILTRNKDVFLPLSRRAGIAVKQNAHIFISVHADAWIKADAQGSSVYTLSVNGASSLQARWLAQSQNRADEIGGQVMKDVPASARSSLVDLLAETKLRYGIQLGDEVLSELAKLGPLHKSSVEYAEFAVLKAQGIPSILVETAFISNPKEENRLRDARQQTRFAQAIFNGIRTAIRKDPSLLRHS